MLLADKIFDEIPLDENENYVLVSTYTYCKDDMLSRLLGVSLGMGNYYNLAYSNSDVNAGKLWTADSNIIIKWNSKTNTGTATIIRFGYPIFKDGVDEYAEWMRFVKGDYSSENIISLPTLSFEVTKPITKADYDKIISGKSGNNGVNILNYIRNLPDKIPIVPNFNNGKSNGTNTNNNTHSNINDGHEKSNKTYISSNNTSSSSSNHNSLNNGLKSNVGISTKSLTSNDGVEAGNDELSNGKSYEVSKTINKKEGSNYIIFAIIIMIILGMIAGYGFIRNKNEN